VRQDSARVGLHLRSAENAIAESDRKLGYLRDKFAEIHTPKNLIHFVESDMHPAEDRQIIWLRTGRSNFKRAEENDLEPFALSFELAFLEDLSRRERQVYY